MAKISDEFISRYSSKTTAKAVILAWLINADEKNQLDKKKEIFARVFRKSEIKNEFKYLMFITKTHDSITLNWAFDVLTELTGSDEPGNFFSSCIELATCDGVISPKELVILNYLDFILGYDEPVIELLERFIDSSVNIRVDYESEKYNAGSYKHEHLSSVENIIHLHLILSKGTGLNLEYQEKYTFKGIIESNKDKLSDVSDDLMTLEPNPETYPLYVTVLVSMWKYKSVALLLFMIVFITSLVLDSKKNDMWLDNQLHTGAQPYSICYGNSASCYGNDCSSIQVEAGNNDVIVIIKNRYDQIGRHNYIRSFDTHSIKLSNGSYQTFFYSGKGWNPDKVQKNETCKDLRGGFVQSESFSKDNQHNRLDNNILTYQLRGLTSGNFRPGRSSSGDVF